MKTKLNVISRILLFVMIFMSLLSDFRNETLEFISSTQLAVTFILSTILLLIASGVMYIFTKQFALNLNHILYLTFLIWITRSQTLEIVIEPLIDKLLETEDAYLSDPVNRVEWREFISENYGLSLEVPVELTKQPFGISEVIVDVENYGFYSTDFNIEVTNATYDISGDSINLSGKANGYIDILKESVSNIEYDVQYGKTQDYDSFTITGTHHENKDIIAIKYLAISDGVKMWNVIATWNSECKDCGDIANRIIRSVTIK